MESNSGLGLC